MIRKRALYIQVKDGEIADTVEVGENVYADVDEQQEIIGLEFLNPDKFLAFIEAHDGVLDPPRRWPRWCRQRGPDPFAEPSQSWCSANSGAQKNAPDSKSGASCGWCGNAHRSPGGRPSGTSSHFPRATPVAHGSGWDSSAARCVKTSRGMFYVH